MVVSNFNMQKNRSYSCLSISTVKLGALTSKPYAFVSRSWELDRQLSFDFTDGSLTPLHFFYRGVEIIRVLPFGSLEESEWISDRSRFFYEGFKLQRLSYPLLRLFYSKELRRVSWFTAFSFFSMYAEGQFLPASFFQRFGHFNFLGGSTVGFDFLSGCSNYEQLSFLKSSFSQLGLGQFYSAYGSPRTFSTFLNEWRPFYFSDGSLSDRLESIAKGFYKADFLFLFFNPRIEAPLLNARFRALSKNVLTNILTFGAPVAGFLNYSTYDLGSSFSALMSFIQGRHRFCRYFARSSSSKLIVVHGASLLENSFSLPNNLVVFLFHSLVNVFAKYLGGRQVEFFPFYQNSTLLVESEVNFPQFGWNRKSGSSVLYILENNEVEVASLRFNLVVYQGFQAEHSLRFADLVFPTFAYFEEEFPVWSSSGQFRENKALRRGANAGIRMSTAILEKLHLFLYYRNSAGVRSSGKGARPYSRVSVNSRGRYSIRFAYYALYQYFLVSRLSLDYSNCISSYLLFLDSLKSCYYIDMGSFVNKQRWACEFVGVSSPFSLMNSGYSSSQPCILLSSLNIRMLWDEFCTVAELFIFRNMAFLPVIHRRVTTDSVNPRFFVFFGGLPVDMVFEFFRFTYSSGYVRRSFTLFAYYYSKWSIRANEVSSFSLIRNLVRKTYVSSLLTPFKKILMRRIFRICAASVFKFQTGAMRSIQAAMYVFERAGKNYNIINIINFKSLLTAIYKSRNFSSEPGLVSLTYPVQPLYLDLHISSSIRLSRTLFLKSRYFSHALTNFNLELRN